MSERQSREPAWIFVSHASKDLSIVRKVRNHLEDRGAAPLLFHLKAMTKPEQFWPLIESEIASRRFFLFCDSPAAQQSEWVKREREAVGRLPHAPKIGRVDVSGPTLDTATLDAFLKRTRVFLSYSRADAERIQPFVEALRQADYQVLDFVKRSMEAGLDAIPEMQQTMDVVSATGAFIPFLSRRSIESKAVGMELTEALARNVPILPVVLEDLGSFPSGEILSRINHLQFIQPRGEEERAKLPELLLSALARLD